MSSTAVIIPRNKSADSMRRVDSKGNFLDEKINKQDQVDDDELQIDDLGGFIHSFVKIVFYALPELF
jgi:hypothetical protein